MTNRGLTQLADTLTPCGSVTDRIAGARARDTLAKAAEEHGWLPLLDPVSPTLVPVLPHCPIASAWHVVSRTGGAPPLKTILTAARASYDFTVRP